MRTVYRAFDHGGRLLYVGQTDCFDQRLRAHRRSSPWYAEVQSWTCDEYSTYWQAHDAEAVAIRTEDPVHNVQLNPRFRRHNGKGTPPYSRHVEKARACG